MNQILNRSLSSRNNNFQLIKQENIENAQRIFDSGIAEFGLNDDQLGVIMNMYNILCGLSNERIILVHG